MNMAKNFQELRARMSAGARAVSAAEHRRLVEEMSLRQLRKAGARHRSGDQAAWRASQ